MSRRVKLPGADELFRPTQPVGEPEAEPVQANGSVPSVRAVPDAATAAATVSSIAPSGDAKRGPSGRVRHDEKITIYVTADELIDLEDTRLTLRREHGVAVDRGRIVREAIHLALEEVDSEGSDSALVRRLLEL